MELLRKQLAMYLMNEMLNLTGEKFGILCMNDDSTAATVLSHVE